MIPDDDPRYQEGITIMIGLGLNEKSKQKSKKNKEMVTKVEVDRKEEGLTCRLSYLLNMTACYPL
jgi:hypothetical protein